MDSPVLEAHLMLFDSNIEKPWIIIPHLFLRIYPCKYENMNISEQCFPWNETRQDVKHP